MLSFVDPNKLRGTTQPRWAYVPNVPDNSAVLTKIETVDKEGRIDVVDGTKSPESVPYPIITLAYSEKLKLPAAGAQTQAAAPTTEDTLMMDKIRFNKDHEPWIKGAAEVYMVVSYFDPSGKGATELIELQAVDHDGKDYDIRQLAHIWKNNKYQLVNFAFFEHDSGHDFSTLAKGFAMAAAGIATAVIDPTKTTTIAVVGVVEKLASAVIDGLPKGTFSDDDDFMDQVNSIEKHKTEQRKGVLDNVQLDLRHYEMPLND